MLGNQEFDATAYHPQTREEVRRFNKTIIAYLWYYLEEHQTDWDHYFQTEDIHIQREGSQIERPDTDQCNTVFSATWPAHCKHFQRYTKWYDRTITFVRFLQSITS